MTARDVVKNGLDSASLALIFLVLQVLLCSVAFLFGCPCRGEWFWIALSLTIALAWVRSSKCALIVVGLVLVSLLLCCYTFSYVGSDAGSCHTPMQRLLVLGWNPAYESHLDVINAKLAEIGDGGFKQEHMLYAPKFTVYTAAIVAKGCGLWIADSFIGWMLLFIASFVGYRFAKIYFSDRWWFCAIFAIAVNATSTLIWMMAGFVDYTIYAAMVISALAGISWVKTTEPSDLISFWAAVVICVLSKATGIGYSLLLAILVTCLARGRWRMLLFAFSAAVMVVCIVGYSPMITTWFGGSSSLDSLTSDFGGNEDFMRMGYLARICYAWFSSKLAVWGCSIWYGVSNFSPTYEVSVSGRSALWTTFLWLSIGALAFSKKNAITLMCVFLFCTANFVPLKYIGYARYCPQMGLIPCLAFANLWCHPVLMSRSFEWLRKAYCGAYFVYLVPTLATIVVYFGVQLVEESVRQAQLVEMHDKSLYWQYDSGSAIMIDRARLAGVELGRREGGCRVTFARNPSVFAGKNLLSGRDLRKKDLWIYGGPTSYLMDFAWKRWFFAFANPPAILIDRRRN